MDDLYTQIKRFFEPESVAVIGVSTRTGPGSFNMMEAVLERGFKGRIYGVNPKGGEILGVKVYPTIIDVPEVVDLAVVATPRTAVPGIVGECAAKGVKAVIIVTQGFADADSEGKRLQEEIAEAARGTGTRIVGPNTLGVANAFNDFYTAFTLYTNKQVPTGVICQSGIFLAAALDFTAGVGFGIDIGNASDVNFADVLEYFEREDRVKVINMHMEGLNESGRFMEAARRISRKKPLFCLKTGRSEKGALAAGSHSGSLAGEDHVYGAAFRQCGIIRAGDVNELHDLNKTFLTYPGIRGRKVAVITITGGGGIAAVDACERYGMEVAVFSGETLKDFRGVYPSWMEAGNPADIWPAAMSRGYRQITAMAMEKVFSDPGVDAVVCITPAYLPPAEDQFDIARVLKEAAKAHRDKPMAVWVFGAYRRELAAILEEDGAIAAYSSPERAVRSLAALHRYHHEVMCAPPARAEELADIDHARAGELIRLALEGTAPQGRLTILGENAFALLEAYGIPAAPLRRAANRREALAMAGEVGYPLVMKLDSPDVSHKSEVGGVKTGLTTAEAVGRAYDEIMESAGRKAPGARVYGVILQEQLSGGTETILGANRDPQFGPVLVYGLGGIYTELFRDVSFRVAPVDREEALKMVMETKSYHLLKGLRGGDPADIQALTTAIVRLSRLIAGHPEIDELDINPLLAGPGGVVALDARIVLR